MKTSEQRFRKAVKRRLRQRVGKQKARLMWAHSLQYDYYVYGLDFTTVRQLVSLMIEDYIEFIDITDQIVKEYYSLAVPTPPEGSLAWMRQQLKLKTEQYNDLTAMERTTQQKGEALLEMIKGFSEELKAAEQSIGTRSGPGGDYKPSWINPNVFTEGGIIAINSPGGYIDPDPGIVKVIWQKIFESVTHTNNEETNPDNG